MSESISRRKIMTAGLTVVAGGTGLVLADRLANRYGLIPPDHGGVFGVGETLTYAAQRVLMSHHSLAREFSRSEISKVAPVNGKPPEDEGYQRLLHGGFAEWRLTVDGLVARPSSFSLDELKSLPSKTQITMQSCEEGWSFIAEWTGVPLNYVLNVVGIQPQAKYIVFFPFDKWWESIDMVDALHGQTLLAYSMNGRDLLTDHGAPIRVRVPRQLGYKNVKYLSHVRVVDSVKGIGKGLGGANPEDGYSWYAGI